jgi:hypothetical protein
MLPKRIIDQAGDTYVTVKANQGGFGNPPSSSQKRLLLLDNLHAFVYQREVQLHYQRMHQYHNSFLEERDISSQSHFEQKRLLSQSTNVGSEPPHCLYFTHL